MKNLEFDLEINDIIRVDNKTVQYVGKHFEHGIIIQDIHTKSELSHLGLIQREATKDEIKWFCERTENSLFVAPLKKV